MGITLQQFPLGTGFTERFTLLVIHSAKICKGSWSSDYMQKQTRAKTLDCLFVLSRMSNFSAIWRLSPLPVIGLEI
jgi:hypothetical protein